MAALYARINTGLHALSDQSFGKSHRQGSLASATYSKSGAEPVLRALDIIRSRHRFPGNHNRPEAAGGLGLRRCGRRNRNNLARPRQLQRPAPEMPS